LKTNISALLLASTLASVDATADEAFASHATIKQCELGMEVAMMIGDTTNAVHVHDARTHLQEPEVLIGKAESQYSNLGELIDADFGDEK
jgi:hypothetical protein